jgi:uncharacterized repeat protein (TIGR01451 family)
MDAGINSVPPFDKDTVFPNWLKVPTTQVTVSICDDVLCAWCLNSPIVSVTMMNYGTANGTTDITGMYFYLNCGNTAQGTFTMTYAGIWDRAGLPYPAWTWAGSIPWAIDPNDTKNGCLGIAALSVYTDIGSCPADGETIQLGPGYDPVSGWGGIREGPACNGAGPWAETSDPAIKTIRYVMKSASTDVAAPGDTVSYTIFYGKPGTGNLNWLSVIDSIPDYMHVAWFGAFAPDPGWNPDPGPPNRLKWTIPGPINPAGGATSEIIFGASIDWGNGEGFEPGSGDVAAVEGSFLFNSVHVSWDPVPPTVGACFPAPNPPMVSQVSNAVSTVVKRYLFWKIGDNDVLFSPRPGQPDDEIIYDIFMKNLSMSKTWWNVMVWDTVPDWIDAWSAGYGFDDPCTGWTITPSGCSAASPGKKLLPGSKTLMTWKLDMPPGFTLSLRWKGKLKTAATPQGLVTNRASIRAMGASGQIGGSGDAVNPRAFTHEATVILRTTFVSYVGWAGDDTAWFKGCNDQVYHISFFALNKASDFQLYKRWCGTGCGYCDPACTVFATVGGVSPKIDVFAGTCTGGPAIDWDMGCKAERAPARFRPSQLPDWGTAGNITPFNFLHKMVSNAPMVWELALCLTHGGADANSYAGTSSLTFNGYIAYTRTTQHMTNPLYVTGLIALNTDDNVDTSIYVFRWNNVSMTWEFVATTDLYRGSVWGYNPTEPNFFRVISSASKIILHKSWTGLGIGGSYNDMGTLAPNRENGGLVNIKTNPATFYLLAGHLPFSDVAIVGNVGAVAANYSIYRYTPFDMLAKSPNVYNISIDLVSNAGSWSKVADHTVEASFVPGAVDPANPNAHIYGADAVYDNSCFTTRYRAYKVVVNTGTVQVYCGHSIIDEYSGGSMLHCSLPADDAKRQTGQEYWMHGYIPTHLCCGNEQIMCFDVFVPKINNAVRCISSDGFSATYTTNDTDECVSFMSITAAVGVATKRRNWKITSLATGNQGDLIAQYICSNVGEKFYTAPFLQKGVFYEITGPPTVYAGENFWITIVVIDSGGGTKQDYCGTTSFTSTDPLAKINAVGMDSFNFAWTSSKAACNVPPNEDGVTILVNVSFQKIGMQTMVASDLMDGTITGLATFMVVGVDVKLWKEPRMAIQASGDTVTFKVCWSNYSSASAFTFTITDAVPVGTTYVPDAANAALCGATDAIVPALAHNPATTGTTPTTGWVTVTGASAPPLGTRWLRWTVPFTGVQTTGCLCYRVSVD